MRKKKKRQIQSAANAPDSLQTNETGAVLTDISALTFTNQFVNQSGSE